MTFELNVGSVLIYFLAYVLTVILGYFVIEAILKKFPLPEKGGGLKGAGAAIGILERIFALTFVLASEYTAMAIIFAAKSIARFEELKDRKFAEYYLIGTLSSILFAMIIGIITLWLLKTL
ncbi:MAG: hypothetical protein AB1665_06370 [Candidatus Thermoplasmatota archaeon]